MISSTLATNGANVYVIGPKQADLDKYVISELQAIYLAQSAQDCCIL
jgi:hypothetical protein